jgi:hypothetical protein
VRLLSWSVARDKDQQVARLVRYRKLFTHLHSRRQEVQRVHNRAIQPQRTHNPRLLPLLQVGQKAHEPWVARGLRCHQAPCPRCGTLALPHRNDLVYRCAVLHVKHGRPAATELPAQRIRDACMHRGLPHRAFCQLSRPEPPRYPRSSPGLMHHRTLPTRRGIGLRAVLVAAGIL